MSEFGENLSPTKFTRRLRCTESPQAHQNGGLCVTRCFNSMRAASSRSRRRPNPNSVRDGIVTQTCCWNRDTACGTCGNPEAPRYTASAEKAAQTPNRRRLLTGQSRRTPFTTSRCCLRVDPHTTAATGRYRWPESPAMVSFSRMPASERLDWIAWHLCCYTIVNSEFIPFHSVWLRGFHRTPASSIPPRNTV